MRKGFSDNFVWGTATSSYQIEGAAGCDGKGDSVWDVFCREPGKILDGSSGDVACDHYNRYEEDFALLESLGIGNYRFSLSWPRLLPDGIGRVNQKGIDFYNRLIDSMLRHNVTPYLTLFHWDYPYELFCKGGWLNRESSDWFAEYATIVADNFSDRVSNFFTLNEPQCFIGISHYADAKHAPGIKFSTKHCLLMAHNVLLAHGKAVMALRAATPDANIGWAPTGQFFHPISDDPRDVEAARIAMFDTSDKHWAFSTAWWSDPVVFGNYPEKTAEQFGADMPAIMQDDMKIISQPLDFYGINIYQSSPVRANGDWYEVVPFEHGHQKTAFQWPVTPECLYWSAKFISERYNLPIFFTENGLSTVDMVSLDGKVHDSARIDFIQKHLLPLRRAASEGIDVRGYFHWSFMDNFEWNSGYQERFGLVHVDFETLKRTPKNSAYYYSEVVKSNGANLDEPWV